MAKSQKPESPEKIKPEAGKKDQALDRAVSQIEKQFGKGSIMPVKIHIDGGEFIQLMAEVPGEGDRL